MKTRQVSPMWDGWILLVLAMCLTGCQTTNHMADTGTKVDVAQETNMPTVGLRLEERIAAYWLDEVVAEVTYAVYNGHGNFIRRQNTRLRAVHLSDPCQPPRQRWGIVIPGGALDDPNHYQYRIDMESIGVRVCDLTMLAEGSE